MTEESWPDCLDSHTACECGYELYQHSNISKYCPVRGVSFRMMEAEAASLVEDLRWAGEPACPHCDSRAVYRMEWQALGDAEPRFLWRCRSCKKQFTVRVGTILEDSPIQLRHWLRVFYEACNGGITARRIRDLTGVSYKSALTMMDRIRWATEGE